MLVGNHKEQGVFERLRHIENRINLIGVLVITPLWIMVVFSALDRW